MDAYLGAAKCLSLLKKPLEAIKLCQDIQKLDPNFIMSYVIMAEAFQNLKEDSDALKSIQAAYELKPESPQVLAAYGGILVGKGKLNEGVEMLEEALKHDTNAYYLYHNLGVAYENQSNSARVLYCIQHMYRLRPTFRNLIRLFFAHLNHKRLSKPLMAGLLGLIIVAGLLQIWQAFVLILTVFILIIILGYWIKK